MSRNWHLFLCPYEEGPQEPAADYPQMVVAGQKWIGLTKLLTTWFGWQKYDYIWLPDDDLLTDGATINTMFDLSAAFNAKISSPALSRDSYYSHEITLQNTSFFARAVTLVEIMMPCVRRDILEVLLPSLEKSKSGYGFGLDFVWAHQLDYHGLVIFDAITVRHTRPVGGAHQSELVAQGNHEMHQMTIESGIYPQHKTLGAYNRDGGFRPADDPGFLLDLLNGYRYLIEKKPSVLNRIVQNQAKDPPLVKNQHRNLAPSDSIAQGGKNALDSWYQVDLQCPHNISAVSVFLSKDGAVCQSRLTIETAMIENDWTIRAVKLDNLEFGGRNGSPHTFKFSPSCVARFIRITVIAETDIMFDKVGIFGDVFS